MEGGARSKDRVDTFTEHFFHDVDDDDDDDVGNVDGD